jgi:hypothetical protein
MTESGKSLGDKNTRKGLSSHPRGKVSTPEYSFRGKPGLIHKSDFVIPNVPFISSDAKQMSEARTS